MSWIQCECGRIIHDNSDALSYKGYLVSDREYFKLLDFCDSLIESPEPDRERLCIKLRKNLGVNDFIELRDVFQCPDCGRTGEQSQNCIFIQYESRNQNADERNYRT